MADESSINTDTSGKTASLDENSKADDLDLDREDEDTPKNSLKQKNKNVHILLLFAVIIIEGYVVLSTELLAIRQSIPFVGSGTDTISVIIAAVLMPLACGYYIGGRFKPGFVKHKKKERYFSVRKKLIQNIVISAIILLLGLSYPLFRGFFLFTITQITDHRLVLITLYCLLFIVGPVFLLGQTIPLVSNYFSKERLSRITGQILFFSTVGSFLGAVISTVVLMSTIGVHYTAALNFFLLAILVVILSKKKLSESVVITFGIAFIALYLNSSSTMHRYHVIENNQYNTIAILKDGDQRILSLNGNRSSSLDKDGRRFFYIELAEEIAINPILESYYSSESQDDFDKKKILVIGAGAFTFGLDDDVNTYHFVDIDKSLLGVAEKYILQEELTDNKHFYALPARAFLAKSQDKYDVIFLDAYLGDRTIPEHLVTAEFFDDIRQHLSEEGIVMMNFIISPTFRTRFSRHIDNTIRTIFPFISRTAVTDQYKLWEQDPNKTTNVLYIYRHNQDEDIKEIYTDNKNRVFLDKRQRR